MVQNEKRLLRSSLIAAFLSGFASLVYQVVWQRVLSQEVGVDLIATKVIVVVFLLGLALGYYCGKRLALRAEVSYAKWFGYAEMIVGLTGLVSVPILRSIKYLVPTLGFDYSELVLGSLMMLLPTFFMGLSTPMLIGSARQVTGDRGELIGRLYGFNVLGAAFGAAISGLILIECFGLYLTSVFACFANLGAVWTVMSRSRTTTVPELRISTERRPLPLRIALAAVFLGFASLSFEMASFRSIFFFFGLASYQFPILLAEFLLAMALGEILGGKLCSLKKKFGEDGIIILLTLFTALALAGSYLVSYFPPGELATSLVKKRQLLYLICFATVFMTPVVFVSAFFPVLVEKISLSPEDLPRRTALLLFLNTLANAAGGLVAAFWIFPALGTDISLIIVMGLVVGSALLISKKRSVLVTGLGSLGFVFLFSHHFFQLKNQIELVESSVGVFDVAKDKTDEVKISLFRTPSATAFTGDSDRLAEAVKNWSMNDLWAVSELKPKRALVIGLGHGLVVENLVRLPSVEKVVVVELFSEIRDLVLKYSSESIRSTLSNPKVSILMGDGRKELQRLGPDEKFDVIQLTTFHPWTSGASNLYTKEFLATISRRLTPTGVLALITYVPLLTATAASVFPYRYRIVAPGIPLKFDYYSMQPLPFRDRPLIGSCEGLLPPSKRWQVKKLTPQKKHLNTDDRPLLEYFVFRQVLAQVTGFTLRPEQDKDVSEELHKDFGVSSCGKLSRKPRSTAAESG